MNTPAIPPARCARDRHAACHAGRQRFGAATIRGGSTLLVTAVLLLSSAASTVALLSFLLSGRQLVTLQLEREIALRAADAALQDAEADMTKALRDAAAGVSVRLSDWPAPGRCGSGAQRGLCRPDGKGEPPWLAWLHGQAPVTSLGVGFGDFTGNRLPLLPPWAAGATLPPRYLVELLPESPEHSLLNAGYAQQPRAPRLRITAIGLGRHALGRVVLQSEFLP